MELTEKIFWEDFWCHVLLPQRVDLAFKNDYVIGEQIRRFFPKEHYNRTAVEIGCAPGKWMGFLSTELGYKVTGYEYIHSAALKTRENLELLGVQRDHYNVVETDFLKASLTENFDGVLSFGFVEHFADVSKILDKHVDICKDGGTILIGIPVFRGLAYLVQYAIDMFLSDRDKLLPNHNLTVMNKAYFRRYSNERRKILDVKAIDLIGGFEPLLFPVQKIRNRPVRVALRAVIWLLGKTFGTVNSPLTGCYMICAWKKKCS